MSSELPSVRYFPPLRCSQNISPPKNRIKRSKHVEKIKNSVKHLNDILEDFLSLGKLDEGKVGIHPARF
ncbi:MAG: hypothetical protein WDO16_23655 [Bacteroidota bacterium]